MSRITRRRLLQGAMLAMGSSLLAPFTRSVWGRATPPRPRVVIVVEGNCFYTRAVLSTAAQTAINLQTNRPLTTEMITDRNYQHASVIEVPGSGLADAASLAPLATHGVDGKAAVVLGLSNTIAGGGHSAFQGGLACARGNAAMAPAPTIDSVLAARLAGEAPFDAVRVGIASLGTRLVYNLCALGPGRPAAVSTSPTDAYNRLFATISGGATDPAVLRKARTLDYAKADVATALGAFSGNSYERAKLERYLAAVEATQARQLRLLELAGSVVVPTGPTGLAGDRFTDADPMTRLEVQFELAAAALLGDLTNVVVIGSGVGGGLDLNYRSVLETVPGWAPGDLGMDRHTLQHGIGAPLHQQAILAVTRKHVDLIGKLARTLDDTPEGAGSVLDHTIIVYLGDNGEQHHSEAREWPILLVGGGALGMRTDGRTVVFPRVGAANNRQVSNLWNTIGHATGDTSLNTFGQEGSLRIAPGPLSEIFTPV